MVSQMKAKTVPHATMKALNAFFVDGRCWGSRMVSKAKDTRGRPKNNLVVGHQFSIVMKAIYPVVLQSEGRAILKYFYLSADDRVSGTAEFSHGKFW